MLDRGYTIAATDYVGMGTDGPDSYLVGDTGGHRRKRHDTFPKIEKSCCSERCYRRVAG